MPQAQSVVVPTRFPLFTSVENRADTLLKDAKLINAYAYYDQKIEDFWVEKRPGLSAPVYALNAGGLGMYNWKGTIYAVANGNVYKNGVVLSAISTGGAFPFKFTEIPAATPKLFFDNGSFAYFTDGTTVTAVTDPNFPASRVSGFSAFLDGTLYVMSNAGGTNAAIFGSKNQNDPSAWDPLNKIIAQIEPDPGVALVKHLNYIMAFKQWTVEFFYDVGNQTGSPLGPLQNSLIPFGCVHASSIQNIDGIKIWATYTQNGAPQIARLDGMTPSIVSSPEVERIIATMNITSTVQSFAVKVGGRRFYGLTYVNANVTLVLDLDQNFWYPWLDPSNNFLDWTSQAADFGGNRLVQLAGAGSIYITDADYIYPNDNGAIPTVDLYTPSTDLGIDRRKTLNMLYFVGSQQPGSIAQVRYSDDDFQSWSNFREVDLSKSKPFLDRNGTFQRRAYNIRHQRNTSLRLRALGLQLDLGTL